MDELTRIWQDLISRPTGPFAFRFYLQPVMAMIVAIRDGRRDARLGRPAYLWAICTGPGPRREMIRSGWKAIAKIVLLAIVLDLAYQLVVLRWFYPGEAGIVAVALAVLPYALLRGPINRLARRHRGERREHARLARSGRDSAA